MEPTKTKFKDLPTEVKIAKILLIVLCVIVVTALIVGIIDVVRLSHSKEPEPAHEHDWITVYYSTSTSAVLQRCSECGEKSAKLKDADNLFTPYIKQTCNHIDYTLIKEEPGTDNASDGIMYTYQCDKCHHYWKILITETSTLVIKEWIEKK